MILLSFKRVRNIEPIARSLARLDCIERILVSNNNPAHRIRDWVGFREPRLVLLDQPSETFCGIRFVLARQEPGSFFLAIDDDVFLQPEQVQRLFEALLESPQRVHGVHGEVFPAARSRDWGRAVEGSREEVDVVNQVYAFTHAHVEELFRMAEALGEDVVDCIGDDMLLSFSGKARPLCHAVGPVLRCLSASRERVATFRTLPDFPGRRADLLHALRALKPELAAASG